jgi:predicted dehydrogenase
MVQLKETIEAGQLGEIVHFRNRFAFCFDGVEDTWFVVPEVAGGGVLIDTQVHAIDLFRYLVGRIASVSASTDTHLSISVEDSAVILMQSVDGVAGVASASWVSPPGEATVEVFGTRGTALIDYSVEDGQLRYRLSGEETWTHVPYDGPDRFVNEIAHFLECVAKDRAPRTDGNEGVRVMAVIEAAYRAARNGTVERI